MSQYPKTNVTGNIIAASAGTGKTYQLTSRYLALLALGARPEKMIALTFTTKAAGEFRNRIFQALADAALGKADFEIPERNAAAVRVWETWTGLHLNKDWSLTPSANPVALFPAAIPMLKRAAKQNCYPEQLTPQPGEPALPQLTQDYFAELLIRVLNKTSELQLSTLDSFFNRVVAADLHRSGLSSITPMNDLQEQRATRAALLALLAESEKSPHHESALITLLSCIAEDKGGSLLEKLEQNIKAYLSLYKEFPQQTPWGDVTPFCLPDCRDATLLTQEDIQQRQEFIDNAVASLSWKKPRSYVKRTFTGLATKIKEGAFSISPSFQSWLDGAEGYVAPGAEQALDDELRELVKTHINQCAQIFLRTVQERSAAMYELLHKYYSVYRDCILSGGMCTFDDIKQGARKLLAEQTEGEESGMALNLTTKLDHWMLDEFQDTDPVQWEILSPLLKENAQFSHKTLFVVGDKKQSIYSFRGASANLFEQLRGNRPSDDGYDWQKQVLENSTLSASRRSAPPIIDFTNLVFTHIQEVDTEFSQHRAHESNADKAGYVRVKALPKSSAAQTLQDTYTAIGEILEELTESTPNGSRHLRNGISVAILLRTRSAASNIVAWLRRYKPEIPVQLVETAPLTESSPLGELLLSFFIWLNEPADKYRYNVLRISPMGGIMRGNEGEEMQPGEAWHVWQRRLNESGYAAIIKKLSTYLPPLSSQRMLNEWMEEAVRFDAAGGSLEEWLLHMRTCCRKENGSAQYVQVMTMHKSKGAEFDAVILPFLGSKAVDQPKAEGIPYFISEDKEGILIHPGTATERKQWPQLLDREKRWKHARREDSYNLMYVALTRARFANYIILPGGGEAAETPSKESDWILDALNRSSLQLTPDADVEFGQADWYNSRPVKSKEAAPTTPTPALGKVCTARVRVSPSSLAEHEDKPLKEADEKPAVKGSGGTDFGTAVHECWEQITWLNEPLPTWVQAPQNEAQSIVATALQQPDVRKIFTLSAGQEAYNEQAIEYINGNNEWISGSIDRLVITHDAAGAPVAAHIIDYKTNKLRPTKEEEDVYEVLKKTYIGQMKAYKEMVCEALSLPPEAVCVSLISCPKDGTPATFLTYGDNELSW